MTLLKFVPQCCGASIYRLGLPPASLIIGHYVRLVLAPARLTRRKG